MATEKNQAKIEREAELPGTTLVIRYSPDATISMVWDTEEDKAVRCPTQEDMDSLLVGADLTDEEIAALAK